MQAAESLRGLLTSVLIGYAVISSGGYKTLQAKFAIRHVREGRRIGSRSTSSGY
jgi:hypothetical protein